MVTLAETDDDFANIGTGPLEMFVIDDQSRIHWLEHHAPTSPALRRASRTPAPGTYPTTPSGA